MSLGQVYSRREFLQTTATTLLAADPGSHTASKDPPPRVIDPHVHVWKNDRKYPWPKEVKDPPRKDALPETLLQLMRANGVDRTVLVHPIHYRWDCRYVGDVLQGHRDRFMAVCRVNPEADSATDDLSHWVRDYGFHGVRLSPAGNRLPSTANGRTTTGLPPPWAATVPN